MTTEEEISRENEETVIKEVEWGTTYRHDQKQKRRLSIPTKLSPLNLQRIWEHYQITKQLDEFQQMDWQVFAKPPPMHLRLCKHNKIIPDRNSLSRKQYTDFLATPKKYPKVSHIRSEKHEQFLKLKRKLAPERCSPRLIQLAVPKKRLVLYTWRDYEHLIPPDFIPRLQDLLNVDRTLDLKFARCYFKNLDKKQRHALAKMRRKRQKLIKRKRRDCDKFLNGQIKSLAKLIAEYIKDEPLMALNFKQSLISDVILNTLVKHKVMKKKPVRNSNNAYKQCIVDITDQIAVWIDTICRYVDVQYTESDEELLEDEEDFGEEGEEYEGEEEEEEAAMKRFSLPPLTLPPLEPLPPFPPNLVGYGEGEDGGYGPVSVMDALLGEVATGALGGPTGAILDADTLESLIGILSSSSPEMLAEEINPNLMPGITYNDILHKLKQMRDTGIQTKKKEKQRALEEIMTTWAKTNKPEKVDDKIIGKIKYAAGILAECLSKEGIQMMQKVQEELAHADVSKDRRKESMEPVSDTEASVSQKTGQGEESYRGPTDMFGFTIVDDGKQASEIPPAKSGDQHTVSSKEPSGDEYDEAESAEKRLAKFDGVGDESAPTSQLKHISEEQEGADETDLDITDEIIVMGEDEIPSTAYTAPASVHSESVKEPSTTASVQTTVLDSEDKPTEDVEATTLESGASIPSKDSKDQLAAKSPEEAEAAAASIKSETSVPSKGSRATKPTAEAAAIVQPTAAKSQSTSYEKLIKPVPGVIPAHKPSKTYEHTPDTICCLTLKVWATWLLEVANNAQMWSKWINDIIQEVRRIATIIRGEVYDQNGKPVQYFKEDWIKFSEKVEHMIVSWRQYSMHVKDLTEKVIPNIKGKVVRCCPKCLEDNLIVNVAVAHDITQQLAEAMATAGYWRRWLDNIVTETKRLTTAVTSAHGETDSKTLSYENFDIVEVVHPYVANMDSGESLYELEEIDF